jgi:hypothetical protein
MPKRSRGIARRRIARTPGQSASALDNEFLHGETDKTSDLALDTVGPGEVMSGNQGVKISDDQNSLKAGLRGPTRASACGRLPMRKSARSSDFFHRGSAPVGDGTTLPQRRGTRRSGRRCILDKRVRLPPAALCGIARGRKSQAKEGGPLPDRHQGSCCRRPRRVIHNTSRKPFVWTQSAEAIVANSKRCPVPSV